MGFIGPFLRLRVGFLLYVQHINDVFFKRFVVTNCKYGAMRLSSNRNSQQQSFEYASKELNFYADSKCIKFIKFNITFQKLRAWEVSYDILCICLTLSLASEFNMWRDSVGIFNEFWICWRIFCGGGFSSGEILLCLMEQLSNGGD